MANRRIRVRSKRLDQIDEAKLSLALWLMAQELVEDRTDSSSGASDKKARSERDTEEAA